jgi:hypothetical protein
MEAFYKRRASKIVLNVKIRECISTRRTPVT